MNTSHLWAHYWTLIKLDASGNSQAKELATVKQFVTQQFPAAQSMDGTDRADPELNSVQVQQRLVNFTRNASVGPDIRANAALGLRCFISHQIQQICLQLEHQFGAYYGFSRYDLFPFVLDDQLDDPGDSGDPAVRGTYIPLSMQILQTFDPDRATLSTWITRLVKQHAELNAFLLERGLYMVSDWAILNDTRPKQLQRILSQFHHLTTHEIAAAQLLLASYQQVYLRDRLQQNQRGKCADPTPQQLESISQLVQAQTRQWTSAKVILQRLQTLADRLRQYRIAIRGGSPPTMPIATGDDQALPGGFTTAEPLDDEDPQQTFLQTYRQQFLTCLDHAQAEGVSDRLRRLRPPNDQRFLHALRLFHCDGLNMGEIAKQIGLEAQFQVSRLLNLKELRADVRHRLLHCLKDGLVNQARDLISAERLNQVDQQIDDALNEQVESLMQTAQAAAQTPKAYSTANLFAQRLCRYLDDISHTQERP